VSAGALANLIHNTISLPAFDAIQKICTFEYQHFAADSFVESSSGQSSMNAHLHHSGICEKQRPRGPAETANCGTRG
jgi:hypothetical protein